MKFDKKGLPYFRTEESASDSISYTYEKDGSSVIENCYSNGVLQSQTVINSEGKITEVTVFNEGSPLFKHIHEYTGNEKSRITIYNVYDSGEQIEVFNTVITKENGSDGQIILKEIQNNFTAAMVIYEKGRVKQLYHFRNRLTELTDYVYEKDLLVRTERYCLKDGEKDYLIGVSLYSYE